MDPRIQHGRWSRRLRFDSPRRRAIHLSLAVSLSLAGLTLALLNGATPSTQVTTLATSGSFFALAESGNTLYAASENGGSVLLERSTDRGVDWTASPVPYSIVAGGAPWTRAAVAVDGGKLILAATSGGTDYGYNQYPPPPVHPTPLVATCGQNSTVLLASSPDGGLTWSTVTFVTPNLSVTSLQAGIVGRSAAVAWLGATTDCTFSYGRVQAVTSTDSGRTWSTFQEVREPGTSVPLREGVEMAPGNQGLVVAFGLTSVANQTSQLGLWTFSEGSPEGFALTAILPAPTSWTLQGSSDTLAYLLTPTYLIPLTSPPYTALPFNELQVDGAGVGVLPRVVSLVPLGHGAVEVAATMSDNLGVDCWRVDTADLTVTRPCHVALSTALLSSSQTLPIVALIDGGGWWVAIGASGEQCGYACPQWAAPPYANATGPPTASGAAVGTSVCITGCSSAQGLEAYSFSQSASEYRVWLGILAGGILTLGLIWVAAAVIAGRRARSRESPPSTPNDGPIGADRAQWAERRRIQRAYLAGLGVWVLVWAPFALLALVPNSGADPSALGWVVALSAVVGGALTIPFHATTRSALQRLHGLTTGELFAGPGPWVGRPAFERVRKATTYAYASWASGAALLLLLSIGLSIGLTHTTGAVVGTTSAVVEPSPGWLVLGVVAVVFVVLRGLYHYSLARALAMAPSSEPGSKSVPLDDERTVFRTRVGAALLPINPFVGLLLGLALQPVVPWSPYVLAWGFLPTTYLGIALLVGGFGRSEWSRVGSVLASRGAAEPAVPLA